MAVWFRVSTWFRIDFRWIGWLGVGLWAGLRFDIAWALFRVG